ncbi:uncharacterized protein LOC114424068 [Glycine soja]|uniref:uncharacterized protein n=1 Tax=Glycine max TaxID=3847 RepID=UPI0003DEA4BB|nr:uncharacterized protein LOC100790129 [Glycine max]XP_028246738.1 uncharacterized protein LOC114424068 [Glycine soja]|eukprot:XP_006586475.1 uncharacterized protein LOC100790129 [Glycine max]
METVLPFEVEVPSLRILVESGLMESEWAQARLDQLNLIEGKRLAAMSHERFYQKWVKNAFDKKVRSCRFSEGDLVLKKVSQALKDNRGKWTPSYEGPFIVKKAFSRGALVLTNMDDEELPSPCGDLGHVASLPPKKLSRLVISSSKLDSASFSPVWASGQSPGHATSTRNYFGVGHTKGVEPCPY